MAAKVKQGISETLGDIPQTEFISPLKQAIVISLLRNLELQLHSLGCHLKLSVVCMHSDLGDDRSVTWINAEPEQTELYNAAGMVIEKQANEEGGHRIQ